MVAGASAHGLVALLFDGFMAAVHRAKGAIRQGDIAGKGQAIADRALRWYLNRHAERMFAGSGAAYDPKPRTVAVPLAELV